MSAYLTKEEVESSQTYDGCCRVVWMGVGHAAFLCSLAGYS